MSKIQTKLEVTITLELTEGEAGALDAICGYGPDEFLKWFERNMGKHYIAPYREHIKTLFAKARVLQSQVKKAQEVRKHLRVIESDLLKSVYD